MSNSEQELVPIFRALGDENRLKILKLLNSGEKCACRLLEALNISQPTLSHHMKILCDTGIVTGRKDGRWMHYSISRQRAEAFYCLLQQTLSGDPLPETRAAEEAESVRKENPYEREYGRSV